MSKRHKRPAAAPPRAQFRIWLLVLVVGAVAAAGFWWISQSPKPTPTHRPALVRSNVLRGPTLIAPATSSQDTNVPTTEVAQSVMVTQPLDFGTTVPSPAEALLEIERLSAPDDGKGRTFSILEAFGITNENGQLQLSMRISTEKPGWAALIFKRNGRELWKTRVVPRAGPPPAWKQLTVLMEEENGTQRLIDGSKNPRHILDADIHQSTNKIRDIWPDGTERHFDFIYSACGCPIKVRARRMGESTMRTIHGQVIFPDDPDALRVIHSLMGWPKAN